MRVAFIAACVALGPITAWADDPGSGLYQGTVIVTGTDMRSRPDGIRAAFRAVLVKASGDPSLLSDNRLGRAEDDAAAGVQDFFYEDRMSQIPVHDEQGSRDRPYDLTVRFAPDAVASALAETGRKIWSGDRPSLLFRIVVRDRGGDYALTADGHASERAREALADAGRRFAMRIVLPPTLDDAKPDAIAFGPVLVPGAAGIGGELAWSDRAHGWVGAWELTDAGAVHRWRIEGASLDEAFRDAVGGAMKILSGNGEPG